MIRTTRIFPFDNLDSLKSMIETFKKNGNKKTSYFMLGIKDNIVLHYYYHDPDSVDWDHFYSIAEDISAQIVNF